MQLLDSASFVSAYRQIVCKEIYRFESSRVSPRILDCGASVGVSVFYWKRLYPGARIVAFEADPRVFQVLRRNCQVLGFHDVKLINGAVWNAPGEVRFVPDGADAGRIDTDASSDENTLVVPAVRLHDYLDQPTQLLKLDIEGAEATVLADCADRLDVVDNLFVEFHSFIGREQRLSSILEVLTGAGFRFHIQPEFVSPRPFVQRLNDAGMDQRLNIFAYRCR